jgi:hypothetical protein
MEESIATYNIVFKMKPSDNFKLTKLSTQYWFFILETIVAVYFIISSCVDAGRISTIKSKGNINNYAKTGSNSGKYLKLALQQGLEH